MTPPGRELDAKVAEKVMGWKVVKAGANGRVAYKTADDTVWIFNEYHPDWNWSPSTDIAAAWTVVEKLRERFDVSLDSHTSDESAWGCYLSMPEPDEQPVAEAEADTAPHAICLCALKAMGVDVHDA